MKSRLLCASAVAALIAMAIACGGANDATSTSPTTPTPSGPTALSSKLRMVVKDTPFSDAKAVLVTFSEVSVHASGGAWKTLTFADSATSRTCDLKQLQTAQDILGTTELEAGHYTQVRLTVSSAALYFDTAAPVGACAATIVAPLGKSATMDIPSGQLILNRPFDLTAGQTTTMLLDFDGDKSINQTGNGKYKMQPVIAIVSVE